VSISASGFREHEHLAILESPEGALGESGVDRAQHGFDGLTEEPVEPEAVFAEPKLLVEENENRVREILPALEEKAEELRRELRAYVEAPKGFVGKNRPPVFLVPSRPSIGVQPAHGLHQLFDPPSHARPLVQDINWDRGDGRPDGHGSSRSSKPASASAIS